MNALPHRVARAHGLVRAAEPPRAIEAQLEPRAHDALAEGCRTALLGDQFYAELGGAGVEPEGMHARLDNVGREPEIPRHVDDALAAPLHIRQPRRGDVKQHQIEHLLRRASLLPLDELLARGRVALRLLLLLLHAHKLLDMLPAHAARDLALERLGGRRDHRMLRLQCRQCLCRLPFEPADCPFEKVPLLLRSPRSRARLGTELVEPRLVRRKLGLGCSNGLGHRRLEVHLRRRASTRADLEANVRAAPELGEVRQPLELDPTLGHLAQLLDHGVDRVDRLHGGRHHLAPCG